MICWNKRGVVLKGRTPAQEDNVFEPSVLASEPGAHLIDTDEPVFRMIYTGGFYTPALYYAESVNGIEWVREAVPAIEHHSRSFWFKHAGVYHLYAAYHAPGADNTHINHFASTDGRNFTMAHERVIVGIPDTWMAGVANMAGMVLNGTLYLYLEANWGCWQVGLFTSTDFDTFTPYENNPVIFDRDAADGKPRLSCGGPTGPFLIDGEWLMWTHRAAPGGDYYLPTDLFLWKAPALEGPWAIVREELLRSSADEGVGTVVGQIADPFILPVGEKVHLYYAASANGASGDGRFQIKLAIADISLRELVKPNA